MRTYQEISEALAAAQVLHSAELNQYSSDAVATSAIPSPNASVSVPANNQQCLNDSIIDTERSRGKVTGHSPLGFHYHCLGKGSVSSINPRRRLEAPCWVAWTEHGQRAQGPQGKGQVGEEEEWKREKKDGHEEEEKHTDTRLGKKGRAHFSAHVSVEDWPRKCHFQSPVSRKPLLQNASCGVPDNLGVLILPSLLTAVVKGHRQQFFSPL